MMINGATMVSAWRIQDLIDGFMFFKTCEVIASFQKSCFTVFVPLAGDNRDVAEELRTTEAFDPAYCSQVLDVDPFLRRPVDKEDSSNGNKWAHH